MSNININVPVINPELVAAIEAIQKEINADTQDAYFKAIKNARFLSPVTIEPKPEPGDAEGKTTLKVDTKISFVGFTDDSGDNYLPVYTDWTALKQWRNVADEQTLITSYDDISDMIGAWNAERLDLFQRHYRIIAFNLIRSDVAFDFRYRPRRVYDDNVINALNFLCFHRFNRFQLRDYFFTFFFAADIVVCLMDAHIAFDNSGLDLFRGFGFNALDLMYGIVGHPGDTGKLLLCVDSCFRRIL